MELLRLNGICFCGVTLRKNICECKRAHLDSSVHTVGERILGFDYCGRAGELGGMLKCFTGVGIGGNETPRYFNAKADWNMDIIRSTRMPPPVKHDESSFSMAAQRVFTSEL